MKRYNSPELTATFLEVLRSSDEAPLVRFAAMGLRHAAGQPEVTDALIGLMADASGDLAARTHATRSVASALKSMDETTRTEVEGRVHGLLVQISRGPDSAFAAECIGTFARFCGGSFNSVVLDIYRQTESEDLRVAMRSDPTLGRSVAQSDH